VGGQVITTQIEIPGAVGRAPGKGQATDKYGHVIDVYNLWPKPIPPGARALVQHQAGGKWTIVKVQD